MLVSLKLPDGGTIESALWEKRKYFTNLDPKIQEKDQGAQGIR